MNNDALKEDTQNVQDTKQQIDDLKAQLIEMENNWKRALADYKNLEKRMVEQRNDLLDFANVNFVTKILPILDLLEKSQSHMKDSGLEMIIKEFETILEKQGLEKINPVNETFNHNTMEAVDMAEGEKNKVMEVLSKGYLLNEKLVRPAKVIVGKGN